MPTVSRAEWTGFISKCPDAHVLQTPAWGDLKSLYGWECQYLVSGGVGALILFQKLPLGFQVAYLPRGPLSSGLAFERHSDWPVFQQELDSLCRQRKAVFLKVEPDRWQNESGSSMPAPAGFRQSRHSIQPPRTIVVRLDGPEEEILDGMKSKTRYNIRLAGKKGIEVRQTEDVDQLYNLMGNTSDRSAFGIHTRSYYQDAYRLFKDGGNCRIFLAEYQQQALAAIMVFLQGKRSWYFYGGSSSEHRERMPTYLVQWEAMRWAKSMGCDSYDLWGVPDESLSTLENEFTDRGDGLWGVYRFKRGFGGDLRRTEGPWDRVYNSPLYRLYSLRARLGEG